MPTSGENLDMGLLEWATPQQAEKLRAWQRHGSTRKAAKALGITERTFYRSIDRLRKTAARRGYAPGRMTALKNPHGFSTVKTTVQAEADGTIIQEWRRTVPQLDTLERMVDGLVERVDGKGPKIKPPPKRKRTDLMLELDGGEIHLGKYAWAEETGADYSADTAARIWLSCLAANLEQSGPVDEILLALKGDHHHADNRLGTTERGGNVLDMDGRYDRIIDISRDTCCDAIELAARHARKVTVILIPGNHDWHSIKWLSRVLQAWYRSTPHVDIRVSARPRQYHAFGVNLIGLAHGHAVKGPQFPLLMATEVPDLWATCPHRHWHLGHIHRNKQIISETSDQHMGVTVEYLPSLSAPDAWHAENGFLGQRRLDAFLWHRSRGLIQRYYDYAPT